MKTVMREMISAAHKVTLTHGVVLSWEILEGVYLAMDAMANQEKTSGSPSRCPTCGGALPVTEREERTGECACGEPSATGVVHRQDGPCYLCEGEP